MKLEFSQIKDLTLGSAELEEKGGGIIFHRFTAAQREFYKGRHEDFYPRTLAPSGVRLRFKTNSSFVFLRLETFTARTRDYFGDAALHPNAEGFRLYFENMIKEM